MTDDRHFTFWEENPDVSVLEQVDLPLPQTDWRVYATLDDLEEGSHWPPRRFAWRDHAISVYHALHRGEYEILFTGARRTSDRPWETDTPTVGLTGIPDGTFRISGDPIRSRVDAAAGVVTRIPPYLTVPGLVADEDLMDAAQGAVTDQLKYGGCFLISGWDQAGEPYIVSAGPDSVYPLQGGGYISYTLRVSDTAPDFRYDEAEVIVANAMGITRRLVFEWSGQRGGTGNSTLGPLLEAEEYGDSWLTPVPSLGMWADSFIDRMAKTCVELAVRCGQISHVLNVKANLPLITKYDRDVLASIAKNPDQPPTTAGIDVEGIMDIEDELEEAQRLEKKITRADIAVDAFSNITREFLQYPGDLQPGIDFVRFLLDEMLAQDTGIPGWFVSGINPVATSGVALDRVLYRLTSMADGLRNRTRIGLQKAINELYDQPIAEVVWESPTDLEDMTTRPGVEAPSGDLPDVGIREM